MQYGRVASFCNCLANRILTEIVVGQRKGTGVALSDPMECYFGIFELPENNQDGKSAVVSFQIPDVGIRFKAPFAGVNKNHSDLASLLALLEFIDSNQKYFTNHTFQIFGNNLSVINQVNGREHPPEIFEHLMEKAARYRDKYRFSLDWVPQGDNPAIDPLFD